MFSVDTNVLARYVLADDEEQFETACYIIDTHKCFVPITVTLELAWVLKANQISKDKIIDCLMELISLANLVFEYENSIKMAMQWAKQGMDIADAIHLSIADNQKFIPVLTFDKKFINKSKLIDNAPNCQSPYLVN